MGCRRGPARHAPLSGEIATLQNCIDPLEIRRVPGYGVLTGVQRREFGHSSVQRVQGVILAGLLIAGFGVTAAGAGARYRIALHAPGQPRAVLYVEETGSGPPLLLLHGLGASTFTWRRIVPALARHHRVIALDMRGFGRSDKPFDQRYSAADQGALIAAFIRKRNLHGVILIGHSFGGTVALRTALAFEHETGRISRLVIIDAPALPQDFGGGTSVLLTPALPYVAMALVPPEFMARILLRAVSAPGRSVPESDIRGYAAPYYDLGSRHAFIATAQAIVQSSRRGMGKAYRAISQPTLLVWCRRDRIVPLATGRRLRRLLPHARLKVLDGCNHLPQDEEPRTLLSTLSGFLH
jgi:pimeloyl-ACP methyl ester carboxylesterase